MKVETADGTWYVRRRWAPRHLGSQTMWARFTDRTRRVRRRASEAADVPDPGCGLDIAEGIVVFLVVIAAVLFFVFIGLPLLIALGELLLLIVLAIGGIVARVLFRRPWTIDAVGPNGLHHEWQVVGWGRSRAARGYVASRLQATGAAPSTPEVAFAIGR